MSAEKIYSCLLWLILIISEFIFVSTLFYTNPYGKFKKNSDKFTIKSLPGWLIMEFPCLVAFAVTLPNYFGEITEWCCLALAACTTAALSFAVFSFSNLFPRALAHHRWYLKNFENYPKDRKAIIPGILACNHRKED